MVKYICRNFTFEALSLLWEKFTLEKIVPQGQIRIQEALASLWFSLVDSSSDQTALHKA